MKKLLAAVTSIAMSSSLITSAFASSITVSAAGGSSAVQPNVSMGGVMDGAVNKIAGEADDETFDIAADFIVSGKDYTVKPGEEIDVEFIVDPGSHVGSTFAAELADLPAGITAEMTDPLCYAAGTGTNKYTLYNGISYQTSVLDKKTSKPVEIEKGEAIIQFTLTIPADIAPGEYEYALSKFRVVEYGQKTADHDVSKFDATLVPGKLVVEGDAPVGTTTAPVTTAKPVVTTTAAPVATTKAPDAATTAPPTTTTPNTGEDDIFEVAADFIVSGKDYTVTPGQKIDVEFIVDPGSHVGSTFAAELADLPAGITAEMTDPLCYAAGTGTNKYTLYNGISYQTSVLDKKTSKPVEIEKGEAIIQFTLTIPADIAPGEYEYALSKFRVVEYGQKTADHDVSKFDATLVPGKLIVDGDAPAGTTTANTPVTTEKAPSTTAAPVVTTTTPAPNPAKGSAEWLIPTVKAKPGDTVTMEVIVNGASDLAVAGASYTVTAESPIEFSGVNGQSDAYSAAIVNNAATNEFAFAEGKGAGVTASNNAVIMTLTYKVPEGISKGEYPVKWSDAFVSDTNGLEITSNVTFTNGAIIIDEDEKFDGAIEWDIPDKVKAKPGETVTMEVVVKDPENAGLPVAGA
ncbi:MAG: hypothetical protein K2J47_07260, partial [Ruminococcus sp.]|nr:hypothetical protein [Ruminococcus sp.]